MKARSQEKGKRDPLNNFCGNGSQNGFTMSKILPRRERILQNCMYGYCISLLLGQCLYFLRLLIRIQFLIMCHQLIHIPCSLTSHHIEWRPSIEDPAFVRLYRWDDWTNVLWELQVDMFAPRGAVEQIPVKRCLLNHSNM
jgi:hypothetical protein